MTEAGRPTGLLGHPAVRWGGAAALVVSIGFLVNRLIGLQPGQLASQLSPSLVAAMAFATVLFALADEALCRGWATMADPGGSLRSPQAAAIYGRGVLFKYLPGSVFQYLSRQIGGAGAGLEQAALAGASVKEAALHLVSSMTVAGVLALWLLHPLIAVLAAGVAGVIALRAPGSVGRAFAWQVIAFALFALSAIAIGAALLPATVPLAWFAALFLVAWLAGFVVPIAPGGIGVREAALIALAGGVGESAALLACVLALRIASILGDLAYGLSALVRAR